MNKEQAQILVVTLGVMKYDQKYGPLAAVEGLTLDETRDALNAHTDLEDAYNALKQIARVKTCKQARETIFRKGQVFGHAVSYHHIKNSFVINEVYTSMGTLRAYVEVFEKHLADATLDEFAITFCNDTIRYRDGYFRSSRGSFPAKPALEGLRALANDE